jgi:DNA-binding NarL/FixJ family response regulator
MRVLVVDDHPIVIFGCRAALSIRSDIEMISASNAEEGYASYMDARPDVMVIDVILPGMSGFDLTQRILEADPQARIIIFTMNDEPIAAARAIKTGAKGYLGKSDDPFELVKAIEEVAAGRTYLVPQMAQKLAFLNRENRAIFNDGFSSRELDILRLLRNGKSMAEIAAEIQVSYKTVANTCAILKRKLGARTSLDLVRITIEDKLA